MLMRKLNLPAELLCKLLRGQGCRESVERNLLTVGHGRHQPKVVAQRVALGQCAQPLGTAREQARRVGQTDARDGSVGKRLNLGGI
jgi:hypothetical protein